MPRRSAFDYQIDACSKSSGATSPICATGKGNSAPLNASDTCVGSEADVVELIAVTARLVARAVPATRSRRPFYRPRPMSIAARIDQSSDGRTHVLVSAIHPASLWFFRFGGPGGVL